MTCFLGFCSFLFRRSFSQTAQILLKIKNESEFDFIGLVFTWKCHKDIITGDRGNASFGGKLSSVSKSVKSDSLNFIPDHPSL